MRSLRQVERGWIDFALSLGAAAITSFALGMSLYNLPLALELIAFQVVFTFVSYALHRKTGRANLTGLSVALYTITALASPLVAHAMNRFLPGDGFPNELVFSAGTLAWMLTLGCLAAWRDQTLIFQAVPCIALFGLIGAFNTFGGATVTFFSFLICSGLLYARFHRRVMLQRALHSGYTRPEALLNGPWRWMAGPEVGLISAATVIILSLVGAPILQVSVQNVAAVVAIRPPNIVPPNLVPNSGGAQGQRTRVGTGPRGSIGTREVLRIQLPEPRYLRTNTFTTYRNGEWTFEPVTNPGPEVDQSRTVFPFLDSRYVRDNFEEREFKIRLTGVIQPKLPIPTPYRGVSEPEMVRRERDGTVSLNRVPRVDYVFEGFFLRLKPTFKPTMSVPVRLTTMDPYLATSKDMQMKTFAEYFAVGASDWDKAMALKHEIERRAKYNLNAEAAPDSADPVSYFLFGPKREGYCDLFASAMVLSAREVGIPARYVTGYYPVTGEVDERGWYVIRENHAHAWAELYFEGAGWLPFDATEGAEAVPGGERGATRTSNAFWDQPAVIGIGYGLAGLAAIAGIWLLAQIWRGEIDPNRIRQSRLARHYEDFVASVEAATNTVKLSSETLSEYCSRIYALLGEVNQEARSLFRQFELAFYSPMNSEDVPLEEIGGRVAAIRTALRAQAKASKKAR